MSDWKITAFLAEVTAVCEDTGESINLRIASREEGSYRRARSVQTVSEAVDALEQFCLRLQRAAQEKP